MYRLTQSQFCKGYLVALILIYNWGFDSACGGYPLYYNESIHL